MGFPSVPLVHISAPYSGLSLFRKDEEKQKEEIGRRQALSLQRIFSRQIATSSSCLSSTHHPSPPTPLHPLRPHPTGQCVREARAHELQLSLKASVPLERLCLSTSLWLFLCVPFERLCLCRMPTVGCLRYWIPRHMRRKQRCCPMPAIPDSDDYELLL